MSPNNPGNFVNDLVEMAKAFEALPGVKYELELAQTTINHYAETVADREVSILSLKAEIDQLHSHIRTLEVDRDHAETMFLEADDRTSRALDFIKATFGNAGSLIQALEPAKAVEPQPEPKPMEGYPGNPIPGTLSAEPEGLHTTQPQPTAVEPYTPPPWTKSDTVHQEADAINPSTAPEVAPAHPTFPATVTTSPALGRYSGKLYSEVSGNGQWPSKDEWLSEGGTLDNFYA